MPTSGEYLRSVVRVFPDYADTVLWFAPGPVSYEDAHLSPELTRDMQAWEEFFYANSDGLGTWHTFSAKTYDAEGLRLCERLADEVGDVVGVEYRSDRKGVKKVLLRGVGHGTNSEARAAFEAMIQESERQDAYFAQLRAEGHTFRWVAYKPAEGDKS